MNIAKVNTFDETITMLGVGNVEGILIRADRSIRPNCEHVVAMGGVVGYQMPRLHASMTSISKDDLLIFATDGIDADFADDVRMNDAPQRIAKHIHDRYNKKIDDALVLVVRYMGVD